MRQVGVYDKDGKLMAKLDVPEDGHVLFLDGEVGAFLNLIPGTVAPSPVYVGTVKL